MPLTLTIGGADFLPQYRTGSARIVERIANKSNTLTMKITKKSSENAPDEGKEIIFKDGARFLFAGFVSRVQPIESGEGDFFVYTVEATDYTYILVNKQAQKNYANQTLKQIVEDLISQNVDSGYSLTTTNVDTGPTINTISFNHISLRKCFEKLSKITGYIWWVDYQKDIHFVALTKDLAPEQITDASANFSSIDIEIDTSQVRNSIVVNGGREETTTAISQVFVGDGEAREWILREKPKTMQTIELDTGGGYVSKAFGVDPIDDDAGNVFMFNFQERFVRMASGETTPASGHLIKPTFKYEVPVIIKSKDVASIAAMKALEGGDGIHAHSIFDTSIDSKSEARARARKEFDEFGNPLVVATFFTRTGLLLAGSIFTAGQVLTANLPTWGILTDTKYTIQEVEIRPVEHPSGIEYHYKVKFGGRLMGVREFLEGMAAKENVVLADEEIDRIEAISEEVTIVETLTRNQNRKTVSETITVAEVLTRNNVTPPWKWEPEGTQPVNTRWDSWEWS